MALTPKNQKFVLQYLKHDNATKAATLAGYSAKSARTIGSRLLQDPEVAEAIKDKRAAQAKRLEISYERILSNLVKIANFDMFEAVSVKGGKLILHDSDMLDDLDRYAIVSVSQGREGTVIKMADKIRANLELVRLMGYGPKPDDNSDASESIADDTDPEVEDRGEDT